MTSLRARKKAETRQRIADVGTLLFVTRGFDNVTIAEIAEAVGVSKVTVFNYFSRKEDIFFDRYPQAAELLTTAIRDRPEGRTPVEALRHLFVSLAEQHHPIGGFEDRYVLFWQTVLNSSALRARAREAVDELQDHLARLISDTGDPDPNLTAALVMAAFRSVYTTTISRMLSGSSAADVTDDHIDALNHAFDRLASGIA